MDLYFEELQKDPRKVSLDLKQRVLALYIELTNNIQLLHQIQQFVGLSISLEFQMF